MRESKHFYGKYLTKVSISLKGIWYTVETCWCNEPHIHFISSIQYSRERNLLMWKNLSTGLYSDIYGPISLILNMMIETTKLDVSCFFCFFCLFFLIYQFGWPWVAFKVTGAWEIKNFGIHFLTNSSINLDEHQYFATTCWFVEGNAKCILRKQYSKERTLTWLKKKKKKKKYTFNIVMCLDTCEPICFNLGMTLDTTKLYNLNNLDVH